MPHLPDDLRPRAGSVRTPDVRAVVFCGLVVVLVASLTLVAVVRRGTAAHHDHAVRWPMALSPADAQRALDTLPTVELAHEVAYDRTTDFGPAWADVDHNGC